MFYLGAALIIRSIMVVSPSASIADLFNGKIFIDVAEEYLPYFMVITSGIIVSFQRSSHSEGLARAERFIVLSGAAIALGIFLINSFAPFHAKQP
jgi:hypothetical protein